LLRWIQLEQQPREVVPTPRAAFARAIEVLAGGAILSGMILGAVGAFVVDKKYAEASAFAAAGAVLTFFGFMHGESVGFAVTPMVAFGYAWSPHFCTLSAVRQPLKLPPHRPRKCQQCRRSECRDLQARRVVVTSGRDRMRESGPAIFF
jgi:hypothetical protein